MVEGDEFDSIGVEAYLRFGTTRLYPLIKAIGIIPPGSVVEFTPGQSPRIVYQYVINQSKLAGSISMRELVEELDQRMRRAIERVVVHDPVGLYLSGGIDSALIGLYLRQLGIGVNAYTSAPWGKISSETPFARENASVIQARSHTLVELESDDYSSLFSQLVPIYDAPHGTTTALGVASIWMNSPIVGEQQVFFGQNSDTATCTVPAQYLTFFTNYLPTLVRKKIHPAFAQDDLVARYLALGKKLIAGNPNLVSIDIGKKLSPLQQLTLAGTYIAHSPADSEVLSQPAILQGRLVSNPYFDVDVVEFLMAIPIRHRIRLSRKSRMYLILEKRVLQQLALRYLPADLVFRKKGFTVSLERDRQAKQFLAKLPERIHGVEATTEQARFAAGVLSDWTKWKSIATD